MPRARALARPLARALNLLARARRSHARATRPMASARASSEDEDAREPWTRDRYGGVILLDDHDAFARAASSAASFDDALCAWTRTWRARGVRAVWLRLGLERAALVPVAAARGFEFHHAERADGAGSGYVMMTTWLCDAEASTIPANASHQVGVGAFVWDAERARVLLVQERRGPASGRDLWKMPTGLLEAGEDVPDAAMREVLEETGIETEFDAVMGIRHGHFGLFGKSDLFLCVTLRVKPESSRTIRAQETEIAAAKWATLEEFLSNPLVDPGSHAHELHERCARWARGEHAGIVAKRLPIGFGRPGEVYTYVADD